MVDMLRCAVGIGLMLGLMGGGIGSSFAQGKEDNPGKAELANEMPSGAQSQSDEALSSEPLSEKPQADTQSSLAMLSSFRSVYEIGLAEGANKAGVAALEGRMVYELNGSYCDGYALTHRFVTRVDLSEGQSNLTDLRSASFEDPIDRSFQFITQTLVDQEMSQSARGLAVHDSDYTYVALSEPDEDTLELPKDVLFPVEYTQALLRSALAGKRFFEAAIYDGTETGDLVFDTTALIGLGKSHGDLAVNFPALKGLKHWPVTIAYFETGQDKDGMAPVYEVSMELYENGVTGAIQIDYPDFSLVGELSELELLPSPPCDRSKIKLPGDTGVNERNSDGTPKKQDNEKQ